MKRIVADTTFKNIVPGITDNFIVSSGTDYVLNIGQHIASCSPGVVIRINKADTRSNICIGEILIRNGINTISTIKDISSLTALKAIVAMPSPNAVITITSNDIIITKTCENSI